MPTKLRIATVAVASCAAITAYLVQQPVALRTHPASIVPTLHEPRICTEAELDVILERMRPKFRKRMAHVPTIEHAIRLWGNDRRFQGDAESLDGETMTRAIIDANTYRRLYCADCPPVLQFDRTSGWSFQVRTGPMSSSHSGHSLACLLEAGMGLDERVYDGRTSGTLENVVRDSLRRFRLTDAEIEWYALAFALCVHQNGWKNDWGESISFDDLAIELMKRGRRSGECFGTHVLFTLAVFLQVNRNAEFLTPAVESRIRSFLRTSTARAVATQDTRGFWDSNWRSSNSVAAVQPDNATQDRILATGHLLEFWAIAPPDAQPPREVIVRASHWLVPEVQRVLESSGFKHYSTLSHAARALLMLKRGILHASPTSAG
jgi:hypothetical protein